MFKYNDFKVEKTFKKRYYAYSSCYWESNNRTQLENGDKIILPASASNDLLSINAEFPMMFKIKCNNNESNKCVETHCSVLEFTADEGRVYLPSWMIENLGIEPNGFSMIELEYVTLRQGIFVQFQAHETKFTLLDNPKLSLEQTLSKYSCLTLGDTISLRCDGYTHKLDVIELKSYYNNESAVCIIDTDLKVDFIEPTDLKQFEKDEKRNKKFFHSKLKSQQQEELEVKDEFDNEEWKIDDRKHNKCEYFNSLNSQKLKNKSYTKSNFIKSNSRGTPLGSNKTIKSVSTKRKVEEIVGGLRYIYEIDEFGNRKCIKKLPIRKNIIFKGMSHSLKN